MKEDDDKTTCHRWELKPRQPYFACNVLPIELQ